MKKIYEVLGKKWFISVLAAYLAAIITVVIGIYIVFGGLGQGRWKALIAGTVFYLFVVVILGIRTYYKKSGDKNA